MGGKPSAPFPPDGVPWCEPDTVTRKGASPPCLLSPPSSLSGLGRTCPDPVGQKATFFPLDTLTKRPCWANAESGPRLLNVDSEQNEISLGRA